MRRAVSSASASGAPAAPVAGKIGDSKLLRTRHIATLEITEQYSRDVERLGLENRRLQSELIAASAAGDAASRLSALQRELDEQRGSNRELTRRLQALSSEADKAKHECSASSIARAQAQGEVHSLSQQLRSLAAAHALCSSPAALADLARVNSELEQRARDATERLVQARTLLVAQNTRIHDLERAAVLPPPAAASGAEDLARLRAQHARTKEKLSQREGVLAAQLDQLAGLQAAVREGREREEDLRATVGSQAAELASREQARAQSSRRRSTLLQNRDDERQRKERQVALELEVDELRRQLLDATTTSTTVAAQPPLPTPAAMQDLQHQLSQCLSERDSLRQKLDHSSAAQTHLKQEHSKVSAALNRMLQDPAASTISISSKQGMFPEFVQLKRDNEALGNQVAELQRTIQLLHTRIAQQQIAAVSAGSNGPSSLAQLQRVPSRPSVQANSSSSSTAAPTSKALSLLASHEREHAQASAPTSSLSSPAGSPHAASSSTGMQQRSADAATHGGAINRRSSGGWPAPAGKQLNAARLSGPAAAAPSRSTVNSKF